MDGTGLHRLRRLRAAAQPRGRRGPAGARPALSAAADGLARPLPALALLAVTALLLHLPSFTRPLWSPDEGFLATQARMLQGGAELYGGVVDRKPPIVPYLYAAAFEVFGHTSLWPLRLLAIGAHVLTAALVAALGRDRFGPRPGLYAGLLYLVAAVGLAPEDARAATFEVFMLPATVAAVYLAGRGRFAAAGLAVAAAALTKQVGGAVLVPVLWLAWAARGTDPRAPWRALAGAVTPFLVVAPLFGTGRFLFWVVTGSGGYLAMEDGWWLALGRASGNLGIVAAASLPVLVAAWRGRSLRRDADLWVWLAASAAAVVTGFHFFGHYFLQLLPPLVLLGAGGAARGALRWRTVLGYAAVSATVFTALTLLWPSGRLGHARDVAAVVRRESAPGQPVLVWGMNPEMYWLAGRPPATRFLTAGFLTNFAGGRPAAEVGEEHAVPGAWEEFAKDLLRNPPEVVVDDSRGAPYRPERVPRFGTWLAGDYVEVGRVGDTVVYRRR